MKRVMAFLILIMNISGDGITGSEELSIDLTSDTQLGIENYDYGLEDEFQEKKQKIWSDIIIGYDQRKFGVRANYSEEEFDKQYGDELKLMFRQRYGENQIGAGLEYVLINNEKAGFIYLVSYDRYFSVISDIVYIYGGFQMGYGNWDLDLDDDDSFEEWTPDGSWIEIDFRAGAELNLFGNLVIGGNFNYGWGIGEYGADELAVYEPYISVYLGMKLGYDTGLKERYY